MAKTTTTKGTMLALWAAMPRRINPLQFMRPIPYKATGSSYGACGIRIDGNPLTRTTLEEGTARDFWEETYKEMTHARKITWDGDTGTETETERK